MLILIITVILQEICLPQCIKKIIRLRISYHMYMIYDTKYYHIIFIKLMVIKSKVMTYDSYIVYKTYITHYII